MFNEFETFESFASISVGGTLRLKVEANQTDYRVYVEGYTGDHWGGSTTYLAQAVYVEPPLIDYVRDLDLTLTVFDPNNYTVVKELLFAQVDTYSYSDCPDWINFSYDDGLYVEYDTQHKDFQTGTFKGYLTITTG